MQERARLDQCLTQKQCPLWDNHIAVLGHLTTVILVMAHSHENKNRTATSLRLGKIGGSLVTPLDLFDCQRQITSNYTNHLVVELRVQDPRGCSLRVPDHQLLEDHFQLDSDCTGCQVRANFKQLGSDLVWLQSRSDWQRFANNYSAPMSTTQSTQ